MNGLRKYFEDQKQGGKMEINTAGKREKKDEKDYNESIERKIASISDSSERGLEISSECSCNTSFEDMCSDLLFNKTYREKKKEEREREREKVVQVYDENQRTTMLITD